ncbi:hypothetical protein SAMN02982917_2198 [Azospirillum oryzae]|uniref:Uncharacterized protein n=1 Tax=Azospirillum oryzae TaxID=286727 RepID=A0A1X7EZN1_9PROT|nr:hypothetical protein [Azospirillum oryzae]SMF43131.1 hypothetical protein SAMN02982917_2198 [Azospirillum oryzae]
MSNSYYDIKEKISKRDIEQSMKLNHVTNDDSFRNALVIISNFGDKYGISYLTEILSKNLYDWKAFTLLSNILLKNGECDKSLRMIEKAIALEPGNLGVIAQLVSSLSQREEHNKSRIFLKRSMAFNHSDYSIFMAASCNSYALKDFYSSKKFAQVCASIDTHSYKAYYIAFLSSIKMFSYEEAGNFIYRSYVLSKGNRSVFFEALSEVNKMGDFRGVKLIIDIYVEIFSESKDIYDLHDKMVMEGMYEYTKMLFSRIQYRYRSSSEYYYRNSLTFFMNCEFRAALKWVNCAISIDPSRSEYYMLRAKIQHAQNDVFNAVISCDRTTSITKEYAEAYLLKGRILSYYGKFIEGDFEFKCAEILSGDDSISDYDRVLSAVKAGNIDVAANFLEKPSINRISYMLAYINYAKDDFSSSLKNVKGISTNNSHFGANENHNSERDSKISIFTSIYNGNIKRQVESVKSWEYSGFNIFSVNHKSELGDWVSAFPNVRFIHTNEPKIYKKDLIKLDSVLRNAKDFGGPVVGLINSDIILSNSENNELTKIGTVDENNFISVRRLEINEDMGLKTKFEQGFDVFFINRECIEDIMETEFLIGAPWWDYWVPISLLLSGKKMSVIDTNFASHKSHMLNWSPDLYRYFGWHFIDLVSRKAKKFLSKEGKFNKVYVEYFCKIILTIHEKRKDSNNEDNLLAACNMLTLAFLEKCRDGHAVRNQETFEYKISENGFSSWPDPMKTLML